MLLIDETRLYNDVIALIGECYGIKYNYNEFNQETYDEYIDKIVEMLWVKKEQ